LRRKETSLELSFGNTYPIVHTFGRPSMGFAEQHMTWLNRLFQQENRFAMRMRPFQLWWKRLPRLHPRNEQLAICHEPWFHLNSNLLQTAMSASCDHRGVNFEQYHSVFSD
jgi:hypothetical protein